MSSSRSAATTSAARSARSHARSEARSTRARHAPARPQRLQLVRSLVGVRWDRLGRIGLLVVIGIVSLIGLQRVMSYLAMRSASDRALAQVRRLTRDNARLAAIQKSLSDPATIAADARKLGMVRVGEHTYAITASH